MAARITRKDVMEALAKQHDLPKSLSEARAAENSHSILKGRNAAWRDFGRNPKGRGHFCVLQPRSSRQWNNHSRSSLVALRKNDLRRMRDLFPDKL